VIASAKDDQASIVAMVTKDLTKRFSAGEILKNVAALSGGRGGGKPIWPRRHEELDNWTMPSNLYMLY